MRSLSDLRPAAALCLGLLLSACSLDYGVEEAAKESAPAPIATFTEYSHTIVVRGSRAFELKAARAEIYEEESRTVLSRVSFTEFDPDTGELVSSGTADQAVFWPEPEDAELSGSVRLQSKRQDAVLESEYLKWDGEDKRLEGRLDRTVTVSRSDGSRVSGAGFEADARRRSFLFRESVTGVVAQREAEMR
jgi:LPS export ABC transporter protein LptC